MNLQLLQIDTIALNLLGYQLSYIEIFATIFGLISVYLAAKANRLTWPTGMINEVGFFLIFYQVRLYADLLLQIYFFIVTIYGWYSWRKTPDINTINTLNRRQIYYLMLCLSLATCSLGLFTSNIEQFIPSLFTEPASYPFLDAFTTIASIGATILLAKKYLETWLLWISVDIICIIIYYAKGIPLIALEYGIFLIIASFGYLRWGQKLAYSRISIR